MQKQNILLWSLFAFQGGWINAGGFLACHRFVTHTTGFATQFGFEMAHGNMHTALGLLSVPVFFLIGAFFSGLLTDQRTQFGTTPHYTLLAGVSALLLFLVTALGASGQFGVFGEPANIRVDYLLLAILCFVSGLQNATVTSASHAVIRTTHLTGLTTDLGIGLARVIAPAKEHRIHQKEEFRANTIRMALIGSFVLGSGLGALFFFEYHYYGFLIPAVLATGLAILSRRQRMNE